jgi:signal peptidase I
MNLRWFTSGTVRQASEIAKHVRKLLDSQKDILSIEAQKAVTTAIAELKEAASSGATDETIKTRMGNLENVANKWLKTYPNPSIRENVEVLLVALGVAMAIRTFVVQPFKIPTGSMQPTLFGVTFQNLRGDASKGEHGPVPPGMAGRIWDAVVNGVFYHYQLAEEDCELAGVGPVQHFLKFINTQSVAVRTASGNVKNYTFWFTPDDHFGQMAGLPPYSGVPFHKGDEIVNVKEVAGDHLFVDRITYNFRQPTRGEIIVFETHGIGNEYDHLPPDQFYIKRMVAMGDEIVRIGNDRHLVINGKRLDKDTPHFENVYNFDPKLKAEDARTPESHYCGHLNGYTADLCDLGMYRIAPLFPDESAEYHIPPGHYMVMGDNTANSRDSRAWGDFSRTNVIGKYCFVYWPFSKRFGMSVR